MLCCCACCQIAIAAPTQTATSTTATMIATTSPAYPRSGPVPGYVQTVGGQPRPRTLSTGLVVAIIVAVVLVAVCVGAAIAIWQQAQQQSMGLIQTERATGAIGISTTVKGDGQ
jgi:hypothetical protein